MNFSIIFPTRERPDLLYRMLDSVEENTTDISKVEVLIAIDEDDHTDFDYASLKKELRPWLKVFRVVRSLNFSKDYYNFLARQSTGRWIITANDDCRMETLGWDILAYDILKDKSGVIYGWIEDGLGKFRAHGHGNYCCFPLQGRVGYEALGYIFPERIPTWGADIYTKNLYDQVNSVVEIPITLKHYCHHNQSREQDNISRRIASSQVRFDVRPGYDEINRLIEAIKKEAVKV